MRVDPYSLLLREGGVSALEEGEISPLQTVNKYPFIEL